MKLLLLDNVKDIGKKGTVVNVADGMARNKLIPLKKGVEATPSNIAKYQHLATSSESSPTEIPPKVLEILAENPLVLTARADAHGSLYKAIHEREVLAGIHAVIPAHLRPLILQSHIVIPTPIKKLGKHSVNLPNKHAIHLTIISV